MRIFKNILVLFLVLLFQEFFVQASDDGDDMKVACRISKENVCQGAMCLSLFGLLGLIHHEYSAKTCVHHTSLHGENDFTTFGMQRTPKSLITLYNISAGDKKCVSGYNWESVFAKNETGFVYADKNQIHQDTNCKQRELIFDSDTSVWTLRNCDKHKDRRHLRGSHLVLPYAASGKDVNFYTLVK